MKPNQSSFFFLFIVFCLFTCILEAQDNKQVGLRAGFITGDISNDIGSLYETNHKNFYAGLFYEKEFVRLVKFTSGLEFMQIGVEDGNDNQIKVSYLALPLGLKGSFANFFAKGGVSILMKIGTKELIDGMEADPPIYDYKSTPVSAFIGGGVRFAILEFEARYNVGISDTLNDYTSEYWQFGVNVFLR